ncbi:MAG: cation diffusion facilitator family transporter [Syntrophales bacterium]|nr:cation diffusion facilitator family transporter [Syntrophales bacterium]
MTSSQNETQPAQQVRKEKTALLSVVSNSILVLVKIVVGLSIGSLAVISEAIHSAIDLIAAIIALISVKISHRPADSDHPFGHGKIENASGAVEAILLFIASLWIIIEAVEKLRSHAPVRDLEWGALVMLFSIIMNAVVSRKLFRVGKETDSIALTADAWHLKADVLTSAGVMLALIIIMLGNKYVPGVNLAWLDPVIAILVAIMIMKAAYDLTTKAGRDLLDTRLPSDELEWIHKTISGYGPGIAGFHDLKTRKAGNFRFVEFHIKVDPNMTVEEAHSITRELKRRIKAHLPATTVTSHIEPCDGDCTQKCLQGCLLSEEKREEKRKLITRS